MRRLDGKRAVVTGGGTGIGRACAIRLADEGARVAVLGRREAPLREAAATAPGEGHLAVPCDLTDAAQVGRAAGRIREAWGGADVLVSNAGVSAATDPVAAPFEEWNRPIDANFYGGVRLCRAFVPLMGEGGRIVFVTSIHGTRVERGASAYAASKAAANQFARALAVELADRGILVNVVAPGFVDTPMSTKEDGKSELETDWFKENYVEGRHLPLKRAARPEEVAGVVAFLAGPDATYMTGSVVVVDGGLTLGF